MGREFDSIDPTTARVVLVEGTGRVLPPYPERLSESAQQQLENLDHRVFLRTNSTSSEFVLPHEHFGALPLRTGYRNIL